MNEENPFDKLNTLYKMLLTPTTFLILISWTYTTYIVNIGIQYPNNVPYQIDLNVDLLLAPRLAAFQITALAISLFFHLLTVFERSKFGYVGKFISFLGLLFTLFLTASPFVLGEMAFIPLPTGEILILSAAIISIILSVVLLWRAKRAYEGKR